jgi:hypothetical protein
VGRGFVVLVVLLALAVSPASAAGRTDGSTPIPPQLARLVTNVPAGALDKVGAGETAGPPFFTISKLRRHLTQHGKPDLLTMNFAWCPHCAANSWALAVALSRFGTLSGLRVIDTGTYFCTLVRAPCLIGSNPCYRHTHGLSFFDASFSSPYLSFEAVVLQDVRAQNLQRPTRRQINAVNRFAPNGAAPAVNVGGAYGFLNSGYDPGVIAGKSWSQIAGSLADPRSPIARHVDGLANLFTAAICKATGGRPAGVCKSGGVRAAGAAHLH